MRRLHQGGRGDGPGGHGNSDGPGACFGCLVLVRSSSIDRKGVACMPLLPHSSSHTAPVAITHHQGKSTISPTHTLSFILSHHNPQHTPGPAPQRPQRQRQRRPSPRRTGADRHGGPFQPAGAGVCVCLCLCGCGCVCVCVCGYDVSVGVPPSLARSRMMMPQLPHTYPHPPTHASRSLALSKKDARTPFYVLARGEHNGASSALPQVFFIEASANAAAAHQVSGGGLAVRCF